MRRLLVLTVLVLLVVPVAAIWDERVDFGVVALPNGKIVVAGGSDSSYNHQNDTWLSSNNGTTWVQVNASSQWTPRTMFAMVALSNNHIILMGGAQDGTDIPDVWRSEDNGYTWSLLNASAGWSARYGICAAALPDDSIVLVGGGYNDTWHSSDEGVTWDEANPSSGWEARSFPGCAASPSGDMIISGGEYVHKYNDTWKSTDGGYTWTMTSATALWPARSYSPVVGLSDNSFVLTGGWYGGDKTFNDTYRTTNNGATWTEMTASAEWADRGNHGAISLLNDTIAIMGGYGGPGWVMQNDIWFSNDSGANWYQPAPNLDPYADFSMNVSSPQYSPPDVAVLFTDGSYTTPTTWNYSFVNATPGNNTEIVFSTDQNPVHTFGVGTWYFYLNVTNASGYDKSGIDLSHILQINAPLPIYGKFSHAPTTPHVYETVQFTDESYVSAPVAWDWDFGDGNYSNVQHPTHAYINGSTMVVKLGVTNAGGNVGNWSEVITMQKPDLFADFSQNTTQSAAGKAVTFNDTTIGYPVSWDWNFGEGGNTSTDQHPIYTYISDGTYAVSLGVVDSFGSISNVTKNHVVSSATPSDINITGWVNNAETATPLTGASIIIRQGAKTETRTSGTSAHVITGNITTAGGDVYFNVTKNGYEAFNVTVDPFTLANMTWYNMTLRSNAAAYRGNSVNGVIREGYLQGNTVLYGNAAPIASATVHFTDNGGNDYTVTTNNAGYAIADETHSVTLNDTTYVTYPTKARYLSLTNYTVWFGSDFQSGRRSFCGVEVDNALIMVSGVASNTTLISRNGGSNWSERNASFFGNSSKQVSESGCAVLPSGNIIITGGESEFSQSTNVTYMSSDSGATWSVVNLSSGWPAQHGHILMATPSGNLVLAGKSIGTWRSTNGGVSWLKVNTTEFNGGATVFELGAGVGLSDNSVVAIGGYYTPSWEIGTTVYRSTNYGTTWDYQSRVNGGENRHGMALVALPNDTLVMTGGAVNWGSLYKNDTWVSADKGITWNLVSSSGGWEERWGHGMAVLSDNSIVLWGGESNSTGMMNDAWKSSNLGTTWTRVK